MGSIAISKNNNGLVLELKVAQQPLYFHMGVMNNKSPGTDGVWPQPQIIRTDVLIDS